MNKLESVLKDALPNTEANGLVLGYAPDNTSIFCLPMWEVESDTEVLMVALRSAVHWADDNGGGEVRVAYGYRDDSTT